jgi:Zn-dependent protease
VRALNFSPQHIANALLSLGVLFFAVSFHETAHAWTANRFGDPTARLQGRISLNPLVHIDPIGSILVPVILFLTSPFMFGWAKPVPVNPLNLRPYKKANLWVSAAGPLSNFILLAAFLALWHIMKMVTPGSFMTQGSLLQPVILLIYFAIYINFILGIFNCIPIFPLDGSKVLMMLLPDDMAEKYDKLQPYGPFLLILLIFTGAYRYIFQPLLNLLLRLL